MAYAKLSGKGSKFQYGDYTLNTGMTEEEIAEILTTNGAKKETIKFTIPEGYTIQQIADKLQKRKKSVKHQILWLPLMM